MMLSCWRSIVMERICGNDVRWVSLTYCSRQPAAAAREASNGAEFIKAATIAIGRDIETTGNTSAASIPLATHRLLEEHPEVSGGLALQIGFGAGLAYAAQVVVLP